MRFNMRAAARSFRDGEVLKHFATDSLSKRQDNDTCLPTQLTSSAPDCAISCLQDFVNKSFGNPSCEDSSDLNYLCRTVSLSGYTIGEGGLQCLIQSCSAAQSVSPDAAKNVYNVCNGIVGAQARTQATITATVNPSSTVSNMLGTGVQIATVASATSSNPIATDTSAPPNLNSYGFVTASSPFPAPTGSAPSSNSSSNSGAGQTAGIAVGSAAGAFGLVGLMFFFCRRRKRQNARRKSKSPTPAAGLISPSSSTDTSRDASPEPKVEDVVPRQTVNPSPVETIAAAVEAASAGISASTLLAAANTTTLSPSTSKNQKTRSYWRKSIKPEEIGVAVTPKENNDGFRSSEGNSLKVNSRSLIPVPESAVLPTTYSSITTIDGMPEHMRDRGSYAVAAAAVVSAANAAASSKSEKTMATQQYSVIPQSSMYEKGVQSDDVEAQTGSRPTTQYSILASARASLSELGSMLRRSVSLKRQPSDAKPLLMPAVYSAKSSQPANKYPLTPKYDNGHFEPNDSLASTAVSPEPSQVAPAPNFTIPRKPTFSSFVKGKLLPTGNFKSPPPDTTRDQPPAMPAMPQGAGIFAGGNNDITSGVRATDALLSDKTLAAPRGMSDVRSPGMMPAPLTIRKSSSSKTIQTQSSNSTPGRDMNSSPYPPLPLNVGQIRSVYQKPPRTGMSRKALEMMGLGSPVDADKYARKPLPTPSHPPNQFANLAPILEPNRLSAVETLAAVKANQHDQPENENRDPEDPEPPLSAATSWLSVPVSTQPGTTRVTMIRSPPSEEVQSRSYQSLESASPRGKPAFPSMAQSLNSIYTKYNHSETQLPTIDPVSAITLTAATYKPAAQNSIPVPPLPKSSTQSPAMRGPNSTPGIDDEQFSRELTSPDRVTSGVQSNISSPPRFTKSMNPYNPYFPSSPARQKSTSSSRSQSLALSSHPTPAVPQFVYPESSTTEEFNNLKQSNGAYFHTPSLRPTTPGRNGSRQPSSLLSPDSADPRRESQGFPKVVVTPNKLPGGDLVLTVDTTGKGYGV